MLSVIKLNIVILNPLMLTVIMLDVYMLSITMMNVVIQSFLILNVEASPNFIFILHPKFFNQNRRRLRKMLLFLSKFNDICPNNKKENGKTSNLIQFFNEFVDCAKAPA